MRRVALLVVVAALVAWPMVGAGAAKADSLINYGSFVIQSDRPIDITVTTQREGSGGLNDDTDIDDADIDDAGIDDAGIDDMAP